MTDLQGFQTKLWATYVILHFTNSRKTGHLALSWSDLPVVHLETLLAGSLIKRKKTTKSQGRHGYVKHGTSVQRRGIGQSRFTPCTVVPSNTQNTRIRTPKATSAWQRRIWTQTSHQQRKVGSADRGRAVLAGTLRESILVKNISQTLTAAIKYIHTGLKYRFLDCRCVSVWWISALKAAANKHNSSMGEPSNTHETNLAKVPHGGGGGWGGTQRASRQSVGPEHTPKVWTFQFSITAGCGVDDKVKGLPLQLSFPVDSHRPKYRSFDWSVSVALNLDLEAIIPAIFVFCCGISHLMRTANSLLDDKCVLLPWAFCGGLFLCCFFVCVMTGGGIHGAWGLRLIHLWTHEDPSVRLYLGSSHVTSHHTGWIWAREVFHGRADKKTDITRLIVRQNWSRKFLVIQ